MTLSQSIYSVIAEEKKEKISRDSKTSPQTLTIFAITATILFWASAYPAITVALTAYTPGEIGFLRYAIASIVLICYASIKKISLPKKQDLIAIAACGFIGFTLYNFMLNAGEMTVNSGMASFIISAEVAVIALLSRLFFNETLGKIGWIGVFLCIIGVGFISLSGDGKLQLSWGILEVFIATLATSVYSVMQKPLLNKYTPIEFTSYAIWAGTLFLFFLAPQSILSVIDAPLKPTLAIIYMGIFPGAIAYLAWSYIISQIPASRAGSYLAIIPVVALFIAWLWLGEIPTLIAFLGGAVVFVGVILVDRHKIKNPPRDGGSSE